MDVDFGPMSALLYTVPLDLSRIHKLESGKDENILGVDMLVFQFRFRDLVGKDTRKIIRTFKNFEAFGCS